MFYGAAMIKQYLLNYEQELLEKKIDLSKALQKNDISIKENIEFIHLIEASEDKSYDSFTPQNYKKDTNHNKIKELKDNQKLLQENGIKLKNEVDDISKKIVELENIIQLVNQSNSNIKGMEEQLNDNEIVRLKLLETQEYERQRIARELHDSTVQSLTSMIHKIELCTRLIDMDNNRCKLELQNMSKTVKETIKDMREVIYNLRPMSLDDIGIDVSIEQELDRFRYNNDIQIHCKTVGNSQDVLPVIGLTMLRIIQEACNNTIKHSGAKNIYIEINYGKDEIAIEIKDDGCGFELEKVKNINNHNNTGFGLSIMYERVYLLSGTINIESEINKGTKIYITIPKKEEE